MKILSGKGSAPRSEFAVIFVIYLAIEFTFSAITSSIQDRFSGYGLSNSGVLTVFVINLIFVYVFLCAAVRRAHDMDMSGAVVLLLFIPLVSLVFLCVLLFKRGVDNIEKDTAGSNNYSSDSQYGNTNSPYGSPISIPTINAKTVSSGKQYFEDEIQKTADSVIVCPSCGARQNSDHAYCFSCGTSFINR